MKKKLLSQKFLSGIALVLLFSNVSFGQQVIGQFPSMDGSFESFTPYQLVSVSSASAWTTAITGGVDNIRWTGTTTAPVVPDRDLLSDATVARSGSKYVKFGPNATSNNRIQSPLVQNIDLNTTYTVQYFVRTATASAFPTMSANINNTTSNSGQSANGTFTPATWTANTWIKSTQSITPTTAGGTYYYASARLNGTAFAEAIMIDDFVVYAGTEDLTAPDAPSAPTVSGLNVSWTAPGTGVDGGGYVVVRYATNPNADNDPNQNGIYAVGNTITNGTGSKVGTVVYIGTGTSFTDGIAGSVSGSDFYKVYAVDKAFNYSNEGGTLKNDQWSLSNPISVYPNPVKDNQFSISLPASISGKVTVGIYNVAGQLVYKTNTTAASNTISVRPTQSLKAGVYVVKVENNGNSSTQKITVK